MIPLTNEEKKLHCEHKVCYICKKEFSADDRKYYKVRDHCHYTEKFRGTSHDIRNLRCNPKEIPLVFQNDTTNDYHFIMQELAEEFEGQLKCLGENTEKYTTFSVPIKKEFDNGKTSEYKLKFIDSSRFMSSSLSSLVDNLCEGLHNYKWIDLKSYLDYISTEDKLLISNCLKCSKNYKKHFTKDLIKRLANIYEFCDRDINKFILLIRKRVYAYEFMDSWKKFNETSFPDKNEFYNSLNIEDITNVDYKHTKKGYKEIKNKTQGDYHDLHVLQMYLKTLEMSVLRHMNLILLIFYLRQD